MCQGHSEKREHDKDDKVDERQIQLVTSQTRRQAHRPEETRKDTFSAQLLISGALSCSGQQDQCT